MVPYVVLCTSSNDALSLFFCPSQDVCKWIDAFLARNKKVKILLDVRDSDVMRDKTSIPRKLLGSLVYDFAKEFASSQPIYVVKESRHMAYNYFWRYFVNFHSFPEESVNYRGKQFTFSNMCKSMFSSALSHHVSRVIAKHEQEAFT